MAGAESRTARRRRSLSPGDSTAFAIDALQAFNYSDLGDHFEATRPVDRAARQPNSHHHIGAFAAICHLRAGDGERAASYFTALRKRVTDCGAVDLIRARPLCAPAEIAEARRRL